MAAIIQFSDGTYHGGGTAYPKPVTKIDHAHTYISPKKAMSVVRILKKDYWGNGGDFEKLLEDVTVWELEYNFLRGHKYEIL